MKRFFKKFLLTLVASFVLCVTPFALLLLNPSLSYAKQTQFGKIIVHHQQELSPDFASVLERSMKLVQQSPLYQAELEIDLCLYEDSRYPDLIRLLSGGGRAATLLNKATLLAPMNVEENYSLYNDHKWRLDQLIAHEITHCYQHEVFGVWEVRKVIWKTEGYAEYISRNSPERKDLRANIDLLLDAKEKGIEGYAWLPFPEGMGVVVDYYTYMLLIQYLIEEKGMSIEQIMGVERAEREVYQEMMDWYRGVGE